MLIYMLADRYRCGAGDVLGWSVEEFNTRLAWMKIDKEL
jgi:hypothetical protein